MSEGRSRVVELPPRGSAPTPEKVGHPPGRSSRSPFVWVLMAVLAACVGGWVLAVLEGRELAVALEAREAALAAAEARLEAYDAHVARVHERVRTLAAELGDLELLLEAGPDPTDAASGEPAHVAPPGP